MSKKRMNHAEFKKRKCPECGGTGIASINRNGRNERCKMCKGRGIK